MKFGDPQRIALALQASDDEPLVGSLWVDGRSLTAHSSGWDVVTRVEAPWTRLANWLIEAWPSFYWTSRWPLPSRGEPTQLLHSPLMPAHPGLRLQPPPRRRAPRPVQLPERAPGAGVEQQRGHRGVGCEVERGAARGPGLGLGVPVGLHRRFTSCHFVPPLVRFIPDSLTCSVQLCLN